MAFDCSTQFLMDMHEDENGFIKEDCENECPMECDRINFDYSITGNEVNLFIYFKFNI